MVVREKKVIDIILNPNSKFKTRKKIENKMKIENKIKQSLLFATLTSIAIYQGLFVKFSCNLYETLCYIRLFSALLIVLIVVATTVV